VASALAAYAATGAAQNDGGAAAAPARAAEEARMSGGTGGPWTAAPVRVWGDVALDWRRDAVVGQPTVIRTLLTVNVNAATYVYEPWFLTLLGGLGLSGARLRDSELAGDDTFVTGHARAFLFPSSRFPTELRYERSDSRIDSGLGAGYDFETTRYGLTQRYRTPDGMTAASASLDRYTQASTLAGDFRQDSAQFDLSAQPWRSHLLQANAQRSRNERIDTGDQTRYDTFVARHSYRPGATLAVETSANVTFTEAAWQQFQSDVRFSQFNSIAFWRPESAPLTVNGGVRVFTLRSDDGVNAAEARSTSGNVGANYAFNRNLRANGALLVTHTSSASERNEATHALAGLTYQADTRALGTLRYDWHLAGNAVYAGGAAADGFGGSAQFGHSLGRTALSGDARSALTVSAAQTLAVLRDAGADATTRQLTHTASIGWSQLDADAGNLIRLDVADSRQLDGQRNIFQLINLQATRSHELSRYSSWAGNLTVQRTRSRSEAPGMQLGTAADTGWRTVVSADLLYARQRLFGVPRLNFTSQLRANRDEVIEPFGPPTQRESFAWENRLDYGYGRLELRGVARVADIDDRRHLLLMVRALRRFGN
jgi:hypothetical protein